MYTKLGYVIWYVGRHIHTFDMYIASVKLLHKENVLFNMVPKVHQMWFIKAENHQYLPLDSTLHSFINESINNTNMNSLFLSLLIRSKCWHTCCLCRYLIYDLRILLIPLRATLQFCCIYVMYLKYQRLQVSCVGPNGAPCAHF